MSITALKKEMSDASTRLSANLDLIMKNWAERTRQEVPASRTLSSEQLYNGLVPFLKTLARVISTTSSSAGGEKYPIENFEICRVHGKMRAATPGYTLDQVIQEYRILRSEIFSALEEHIPLTKQERVKLLESFDNGMTQATTEFTLLLGFPWSREREKMQTELVDMKTQRSEREKFITAFAHDLRTPLTAAKMRAELILREPNISDLVETMGKNLVMDIERTDHMIKDLLDVSVLRVGEKIVLKTTFSNLSTILKTTLHQLRTIYGNRFLLQCDRIVSGNWDPEAIRRIIENLASNAIKYGNAASVIIVTLTQKDKTVELAVHNEGPPLSPAEQELIFRQFKRTRKSRTDGWGIGLTIVRGLAEAHGGRVDVESSQEAGTTFRVTLPR